MLTQPEMWKKWAKKDTNTTGVYAPLLARPIITEVVPTSQKKGMVWSYTTKQPGENWFKPAFDASQWETGPGGFGRSAPNSTPHTDWKTSDIWLRREFDLPAGNTADLQLLCYHDDDVEIYINGELAAAAGGYVTSYEPLELTDAGRKALKAGKNVLAVHCHQVYGGQFIDVGLASVKQP
jgi:hypothetical protein